MDLQTNSVPGAVGEPVAPPRSRDALATHAVEGASTRPRSHTVHPCALRLEHDREHLGLQRSGITDGERPGHVAVVAVVERAEVDHHRHSFDDACVVGMVMRKRGVGSRRDDRVEARPIGAVLAHRRLQRVAEL